MRDETPPWVDSAEHRVASSVGWRVFAGTTLWLASFGWYVLLRADPRGGLSAVAAAALYGASTFLAGLCFGAGEDQVAGYVRLVFDRTALALGGGALVVTAVAWFGLTSPATPYVDGLWLGVVLLGAGIALGVASR